MASIQKPCSIRANSSLEKQNSFFIRLRDTLDIQDEAHGSRQKNKESIDPSETFPNEASCSLNAAWEQLEEFDKISYKRFFQHTNDRRYYYQHPAFFFARRLRFERRWSFVAEPCFS